MISFKSWVGLNFVWMSPMTLLPPAQKYPKPNSGTSLVNEDQRPVAHSLSSKDCLQTWGRTLERCLLSTTRLCTVLTILPSTMGRRCELFVAAFYLIVSASMTCVSHIASYLTPNIHLHVNIHRFPKGRPSWRREAEASRRLGWKERQVSYSYCQGFQQVMI